MIVFLEACVDTYVRSCTPAPFVPAGDVVKTVTDTLAVTGGASDPAGWIIAGCFILGSGLLFLYNHLTTKERRDHDH